MYGTQTAGLKASIALSFENDVKMYGTQTFFVKRICSYAFENDVKMYGTQTCIRIYLSAWGLRMM